MVPEDVARRRGRRAGIIVFSLIVSAFTVVCSIQIILQVWAPESRPTGLECRPGVEGLLEAVGRARRAAADSSGGEQEAMARFRHALEPEWNSRSELDDRCKGDATGRRALAIVDRLRYAEEHAVRYEAVDVAPLRRRIDELENDLQRGK